MLLPCAVSDMKDPTDIRDPVATTSARPDSYDQRRTSFRGILIRPPSVVNDNLAKPRSCLNTALSPGHRLTELYLEPLTHTSSSLALKSSQSPSMPHVSHPAVSSRMVSCIPNSI